MPSTEAREAELPRQIQVGLNFEESLAVSNCLSIFSALAGGDPFTGGEILAMNKRQILAGIGQDGFMALQRRFLDLHQAAFTNEKYMLIKSGDAE